MPTYMNWDDSRKNWLGSLYAEIAVENYYHATNHYERIKGKPYKHLDEIENDYDTVIKHAIATIIFSATALEAFINDYAASCLGDKEFYGSFDKLSVVDKLSLIIQFIFRKHVDKSQGYYSGLISLYKQRNQLIHPKTEQVSVTEQEEQFQYYIYNEQFPEGGLKAFLASYQEEANEKLLQARDAIKTMHYVTECIDQNDESAHATMRLLIPQVITGDERTITKAKEQIYPKLGIKIQTIALR